jgi:hypothetical protein
MARWNKELDRMPQFELINGRSVMVNRTELIAHWNARLAP